MISTSKIRITLLAFAVAVSGKAMGQAATETYAATPIAGVVLNSENGKPIPGVSITVAGVDAAVTDDNGRFTLSKAAKGAVAQVRMDGYADKEVLLREGKNMVIRLLDAKFTTIYRDVTLPFGRQSWRSVSGAVSEVNMRGSYKKAAVSPEYIIQDDAPGVNTVIRSGAPGAGGYMYIRGFNSLNATSQPLVLIDGMPYETSPVAPSLISGNNTTALSFLDVRDIENITIIKDAASLYGSKGANGAILIETGKAHDEATTIDVHAYGGLNLLPDNQYPMLDAWQYRSYLTGLLQTSSLSASEIQALPYINDNKATNPDYYRYHQQTDWQKEIFKQSMSQAYYINIKGGDEIALYSLSAGYLNHAGTVKNTDFARYAMQFNSQINVVRWLQINANMNVAYDNRTLANEGDNQNFNPMLVSLRKAPFMAANVYNEYGQETRNTEPADVFNVSNPAALFGEHVTLLSKTYRFFGNIGAVAEISKAFTLNATFGVTFDKLRETTFLPQEGLYHDPLASLVVRNELPKAVSRYLQYYGDAFAQYRNLFDGTHRLALRLGVRYQTNNAENDWTKAYNSSSDALQSLGNANIEYSEISGVIKTWNWLSYYLNGEYAFADRYFLSLNVAMDGSSRWGKNASSLKLGGAAFGVFPSVSAGWLISSEEFMKNISPIDVLKLRVGYSTAGNDDIGYYTSHLTYGSQNLYGYYGLLRSNIANPNLRWETNTKINAGLDIAALNERLTLTFDIYKSTTDDLFMWKKADGTFGIDYYAENSGSLQNTGFEVGIRGRVVNSAFKWDLGLNVSRYTNRIVSLPGGEIQTEVLGGTVLTKEGAPIGQFYGYKTNGVYATSAEAAAAGLNVARGDGTLIPFQAGDMRFANLSGGDNVIDEHDMTVIGDPNPDIFGSFSSAMTWKRFSLNAVFTYSLGNDIYNAVRAQMESEKNFDNQTQRVLNRWTREGHVTNMPRAVWGDPMGNARFSDRWIEDGSYLRLKTISLAYDIPLHVNIIRGVQVYVTANNLLTFTKYLGYDPEFAAQQNPLYYGIDMGFAPQIKSVMLGVKVGL